MEKSKIIHLEKPNMLALFLTEKERMNIVSLKIMGFVGSHDFEDVLDEMCYCYGMYDDDDNFIPDYEDSAALRHLDMGEATFVDGDNKCLPYFGYRTLLETFIFPQGITTVFETGFSDSDNLRTLVFPDGMKEVRDFENCDKLTGLVLPNSVEEIDSFTFAGCKALTSIRIPASVKIMDGSCFADCNITAYEVDENNPCFTAVDGVVYNKDLTTLVAFPSAYPHKHFKVPETVRTIGFGAFMDSQIETIELPTSLSVIEGWVFQGSKIRSVEIPDTVTEVGKLAFRWCYELEHVRLSNRLTKIPSQMFSSCPNLKELDVPSSVKTIHYSAIAWSHGLERLYLHDGLEEIVDEGPLLGKSGPLHEVLFPKTLKKVPGGVFNYSPFLKKYQLDSGNPYFSLVGEALCSKDGKILYSVPDNNRTEYTIPEGVEVIGKQAFYSLPDLEKVILPSTLKIIKERAFQGCDSLQKIAIPAGVEKVDIAALWADKLKSVVMEGSVPPKMTGLVGDENEWRYRDVSLLVPQDAVEAYKEASGWKCFKIVEK